MKRFILMVAIAVMTAMSFSSCERVDAGHEGILVNLYGSDKGVDDVSLVTGMVWSWIDKWDGSVPSVITGGNSQTFLDISKFK